MKFTIYQAGDVFGLNKYASFYRGNTRGADSWTEAERVYRWKKTGKADASFMAAIRLFQNASKCGRIVAVPGHTLNPSRLQTAFGETIKRTVETPPRKYNHHAITEPADHFDLTDCPSSGKVLLVDDVCTSGASLEYFAAMLRERGCEVVKLALGVNRKLEPVPVGEVDPQAGSIQMNGEITVSEAAPEETDEPPPSAQNWNAYNAGRQREYRARAADIGALPEVADPERRARAEADLVEWLSTYTMATPGSFGLLARRPSPRLQEYARELEAIINKAGRVHVRMSRGAGKSSISKGALLFGLATGKVRFAVIFAANAYLAQAALEDVWGLLIGNETFAADYPEIAFPIRAGEGLAQRYQSQTFNGIPTRIQKTAKGIRLPTIEGSFSSGAIVQALGAGASCRGLVRGAERPDFLVLDDLQKRADALSEQRVSKLENWICGDVMGLQGAETCRLAMLSTPIAPLDLSERFASPDIRGAEWRQVRFPFVIKWPSAGELWEEYDSIWRDCIRAGEVDFARATAFYEAHREDMDRGGEVLDPEAFDHRLERSALQRARNNLLTMGRKAFEAEYQLNVEADAEDAVRIDTRLVAGRVNGCPRYTLPPGTSRIVSFIDVNSAIGLSYVVVAFGRGQVAAVIDYGRVPGNGQRLTPLNATERQVQSTVASALFDLVVRLLKQPYLDAKGKPVPLGSVWIDSGYLQDVVLRVAWLARKRTGGDVWAAKGWSSAWFNSYGKTVVARADGVDFRQGADGSQYYGRNADTSKETMQRAFLGLPLQSGSISLWGSDPRFHWDFAAEVSAERLTDKATSARGVDLYRWSITGPNHWGDCLAGAISCAIWHRWWDSTDVVPKAVPKRERVKASAVPLRPIKRKPPQVRKRRIRSARPAT